MHICITLPKWVRKLTLGWIRGLPLGLFGELSMGWMRGRPRFFGVKLLVPGDGRRVFISTPAFCWRESIRCWIIFAPSPIKAAFPRRDSPPRREPPLMEVVPSRGNELGLPWRFLSRGCNRGRPLGRFSDIDVGERMIWKKQTVENDYKFQTNNIVRV